MKLLPHEHKIELAQFILGQPNFINLPKEIVSTALNLLGNSEDGKKAAKTILDQPEFFNLPHQIVSTALKRTDPDVCKEKAKVYKL